MVVVVVALGGSFFPGWINSICLIVSCMRFVSLKAIKPPEQHWTLANTQDSDLPSFNHMHMVGKKNSDLKVLLFP